MKLIKILALVMITVSAHAAEKEGNGGKGVVCRDASGHVVSARLLDYFEADLRGIPIDLGGKDLATKQKINLALTRLDSHDHIRSTRYLNRVADFFSDQNTKYLTGVTLESTDDSYEIAVPAGCAVEQLIVRKTPQFTEDRLWTVNQDLWNALDSDNQAGLVLHEVIYDELLTQSVNPQSNSINARYYNSYLSSDKFTTMGVRDYVSFMQPLGFNFVTVSGIQAQFYSESGTPAAIDFYKNSDQPQDFTVGPNTLYPIQGVSSAIYGTISFYPNGLVQYLVASALVPVQIGGQKFQLGGGMTFNEDGTVESALFGQDVKYSWLGQTTVLSGEVHFYPNGVPSELEPSSDSPMTFSVYGGSIQTHSGCVIDLYLDGILQKISCPDATLELLELSSNLYDFSNVYQASFFHDGFPSDVDLDTGWVVLNGDQVHFTNDISFYPDHSVKAFSWVNDSITVSVQNHSFDVDGFVGFNEDHSFETGDFSHPGLFGSKSITFLVGGQNVAFRRNSTNDLNFWIDFYPGGILKSGTLAQDATLLNATGTSVSFKSGDTVNFDLNGRCLSIPQS